MLLVRPEDIEIRPEASPGALSSVLSRIYYLGSHYELDCKSWGSEIRVIEKKNNFRRRLWKEGKNVFVTFRTFRIFKAENGHAEIREKLKDRGYIE